MKKKLLLLLAFFSIVCIPLLAGAQQATDNIEMAEGLRASGKIYVVVAVLTTIFAGLILYLISLDRKITRLEKESKKP
jgi:hypothetical protein